jgi:hypothetical protein
MDIYFVGERDTFIFIYLDDMTLFSKTDEDDINHLKQTFVKCRKFGLSLNPNMSYFSMKEGMILDHIVSKEGVKIESERVEAIKQISHPKNKKKVQYFLGKINFLRRFVPNFTEMVKHITNMLKRDHEFKWTTKAKEYFQQIKEALGESPVLISLNYDKDFHILSFASVHTIVVLFL